jgi:chemotaxis protein methyltransferase CheR
MTIASFTELAAVLKRRSGLILAADKSYLVESRLAPLVKKFGLADVDALVGSVVHGNEIHSAAVTEAMTINETSFFRDIKPFEIFRKDILPGLLDRKAASKSLRIWSAASSTGQEAYSIAMSLKEEGARLAGWRVEIVGTDLCESALAQAKQGLYSHFEVQRGLPAPMLVKHFEKTESAWRISAALRAMVQFRHFNLLDNPAPLGTFDIIFCRNVLIYFDVETKGRVLHGMAKRLTPDGALFLGGAETVLGITDQLHPIPGQRGVYKRVAAKTVMEDRNPAMAVPMDRFAGAPALAAG